MGSAGADQGKLRNLCRGFPLLGDLPGASRQRARDGPAPPCSLVAPPVSRSTFERRRDARWLSACSLRVLAGGSLDDAKEAWTSLKKIGATSKIIEAG